MGLVVVWSVLAIFVVGKRIDRAEIRVHRSPSQQPVTIDLNVDPWPRLLLIDGIGEKLAQRIVSARHERGGFQSLEEVMELPGIPDRAIDSARDWLTLSPTSQ